MNRTRSLALATLALVVSCEAYFVANYPTADVAGTSYDPTFDVYEPGQTWARFAIHDGVRELQCLSLDGTLEGTASAPTGWTMQYLAADPVSDRWWVLFDVGADLALVRYSSECLAREFLLVPPPVGVTVTGATARGLTVDVDGNVYVAAHWTGSSTVEKVYRSDWPSRTWLEASAPAWPTGQGNPQDYKLRYDAGWDQVDYGTTLLQGAETDAAVVHRLDPDTLGLVDTVDIPSGGIIKDWIVWGGYLTVSRTPYYGQPCKVVGYEDDGTLDPDFTAFTGCYELAQEPVPHVGALGNYAIGFWVRHTWAFKRYRRE